MNCFIASSLVARSRRESNRSIGSICTGIVSLFALFSVLAGLAASTNAAMAGDVTLAWDANSEPDLVGYKVYRGTASRAYGTPVTLGKVTTYTFTGLSTGTYYFAVTAYTATAESGYSNEVSAVVSGPDTTPPVISGVATVSITENSAIINWNTNEPADSSVEYGTTTAYGSSSTPDPTLVVNHSATLGILTPSTLYHYRVYSRDAAGNQSVSADYTFTSAAHTTPPDIFNIASSAITSNSATITWLTNEPADSQVLYGTTTAYGSSTTLNSTLVTSHSQALSGLASGTTYHYCVRSRDYAGNTSVSADNTFLTLIPADTTPPVISSVSSSGVTYSAATITWTTNEAADTQVDYGTTTAYGSSTTLNAALVTSHSQTLSGLTASTLYHYRVKSKDAAGNLATSGDFTFTTGAAPDTTPPVISSVASSGISNSAATITWTTNEAADTQVDYGTTTAYGSSTALNAALVTSHSQALSGLAASTLYHYRVKSKDAAGNLATLGDFTFTTTSAPDTTPPVISAVVSSGVTYSAATISWTTNEAADTQVDYGTTIAYGSSTTLDAALTTTHSQALGGLTASTTYHCRVKSKDAAGNLATSGDFTFTTSAAPDTTPPIISSVASSGVTYNAATITWTTSEAADSQVDYGTTTAYGSSTTLDAALVTSHSQALGGLAGGTTYHYRVKSKDAAGNLATSGDFSFTTSAMPDTTPPAISAVASNGITNNAATITWTTDEAADTQIEYGTTTAYGSFTILNSALSMSHSQGLSGLAASTICHFRVKSKDAAGNLATSGDFSFITSAVSDTTPPVISAVSGSGITSNAATITWTTDEAADTQVEYGITTAYGSSTILNTALTTSHSQGLSSLDAGTTYNFRVKSRDSAGNLASSGNFTFTTEAAPDRTPPAISNVASAAIANTTATITWLTNEPADGQVEFGTSIAYGGLSALNAAPVTSHTQSLSGLSPGTAYHFRIRSRDSAGNLAVSDDFTFTTKNEPDLLASLVAAFGFDEGAGTTAADSSGRNSAALLTNVHWTRNAVYGEALLFNGSSYASASSTGLPSPYSPQTISLWIYTDLKTNATQPFLTLANETLHTAVFIGYKESQVGVWQYDGSWLVFAPQPAPKSWHHYAYTFDGRTHRLFIDGIQTGSSTISPQWFSPTTFQFGGWTGGPLFFSGIMDELRIYGRALPEEQVQAVMLTPIGGSKMLPLFNSGDVTGWKENAASSPIPINPETRSIGQDLEHPAGQPGSALAAAIDIRMDRESYGPADTIAISSYRLRNPSGTAQRVELKTWLSLPGLPSLSVGNIGADGQYLLPSGLDENYGPVPLLPVSEDVPAGQYELGARVLDPITGDVLSECINPFAVSLSSGASRPYDTALLPLDSPNISVEIQIAPACYKRGDVVPRSGLRVLNTGSAPAVIELKVWLELPTGISIPVLGMGSEGSLVLPPGSDLQSYPLRPFRVNEEMPAGKYQLKARILDPVTGRQIREHVAAFEVHR